MMQVKWEEKDITGGRRVSKPVVSEKSMIGYVYVADGQKSALISLSDGMVIVGTKAEIAEILNNGNYYPTVIDEGR